MSYIARLYLRFALFIITMILMVIIGISLNYSSWVLFIGTLITLALVISQINDKEET